MVNVLDPAVSKSQQLITSESHWGMFWAFAITERKINTDMSIPAFIAIVLSLWSMKFFLRLKVKIIKPVEKRFCLTLILRTK